MKYALFEFVNEKSCEIGETRWMIREDPNKITNDSWDFEQEVMVAWPREFGKVHKKMTKTSVDPTSIPTITCVAKVIQFSDDYETIRLHMVRYCDTGSLKTPSHSRGKWALKPNGKYAISEEEEEEVVLEKPTKKLKKNIMGPVASASNAAMEALREKYNLTKKMSTQMNQDNYTEKEDSGISLIITAVTQMNLDDDEEIEDNSNEFLYDDEEVSSLKKANLELKKKHGKRENEIKHLKLVISNLEVMPRLPDIVGELQKQVRLLTKGQRQHTPGLDCSTPSRPSSSSSQRSDSNVGSEMVSLCPHVVLTKGQHGAIRSKSTLKDFVYAIMGMLWTREVLCTHSITGKASNAFREKDIKPQLDPEKVKSIWKYGVKRYGCRESDVRQIMTARISNIVKVAKAKLKG